MGVRSILTVNTPASTYDLTTLLDVLADLNMNNTDEPTKAYLRRTINQCSAAAAQYCNRVFPVETVTELIYPDRDAFPYQVPGKLSALQLERWPVVSITSLTEDHTDLTLDTDYKADLDTGQLIRLLSTTGYPQFWIAVPVTVQYRAGYATIPYDLQDAVHRMIRGRWFGRDRDPAIRSRGEPGVGNIAFWIGMDPDAKTILDNYRTPVVA